MNQNELFELHHRDTGGFCRHYLTLYSIILGMECENVLELGFGGTSCVILKALEITGGSLTTCDLREVDDSKHSNWRYIQGNTVDTVPKIDGSFDVILHDGSHIQEEVDEDLKNVIPKVKKNGIVLIHDTQHPGRHKVDFDKCRRILRHIDYEDVTLPYGYGLTILKIKEDFGNGEVDIKWRKMSN